MEASTSLKVSYATIARRLNQPNKPDYVRLDSATVKSKRGRKAQIQSMVYESVNQAARTLNLGQSEITSRLNNPKANRLLVLGTRKKHEDCESQTCFYL